MPWTDLLAADRIVQLVEPAGRDGVLDAAARLLGDGGPNTTLAIASALRTREELGSTGIGRGVAVPHTKHPAVDKLVGTVAISDEGVDFDSLDGEKVHLLFLLISPPDRPGDHLRALENISRQLRDDTFCRFLKQSKDPADVWQLLEEADNNQFGA